MAEITIRISDKALKIAGMVVAGILASVLLVHVWSTGAFLPHYRLRMYAARVADVIQGAAVRVDGIDVGSVSSISSADAATSPDRSVVLVLKIEKRYQDMVRTDSRASFLTEGLLGKRYVNITRGFHGSVIPPNGEVTAIPERVGNAKDVLDALKMIFTQETKNNDPGHNKQNH